MRVCVGKNTSLLKPLLQSQVIYSHFWLVIKIILGLIAEPGEKATDIAVWGWDDTQDCWVVYTFDFKAVIGQPCGQSDYLEFHAHEDFKAIKE